jgi:hypothetical protein
MAIQRLTQFATGLVSCLLALSGACDGNATPDPASATTAPVSAPSSSPHIAAATRPRIDDLSLTDDGYVALGLPSYDREWMASDMAAAAAKLQVLAQSKPHQLPRFDSPKSGRTFARLVHPDNLKFFRAKSIPLQGRFPQVIQYAESSSVILKLYLSAFLENHSPGTDLVELMGHQLRTCQVALELTDEFVPTVSKQDPKYQVRLAGLDQMRSGLAGVVSGAITSLTEENHYDVATRQKLLEYVRETLPHIVPKLTKPSQTEIVYRVNELVEGPTARELRPGLTLLRDELAVATKGSVQP